MPKCRHTIHMDIINPPSKSSRRPHGCTSSSPFVHLYHLQSVSNRHSSSLFPVSETGPSSPQTHHRHFHHNQHHHPPPPLTNRTLSSSADPSPPGGRFRARFRAVLLPSSSPPPVFLSPSSSLIPASPFRAANGTCRCAGDGAGRRSHLGCDGSNCMLVVMVSAVCLLTADCPFLKRDVNSNYGSGPYLRTGIGYGYSYLPMIYLVG